MNMLAKTAVLAIFVLLFLATWPDNLSAKIKKGKATSQEVMSDGISPGKENWQIDLDYSQINDPNYSSDAISGKFVYYVFPKEDVSREFWGDAELSYGPLLMINLNSGMLNNQSYTEQVALWVAGGSARVNFTKSYLQFDAMAGEIYGWYTRYSGYESKRRQMVLSGTLIYEDFSGRLNGEWFAPAWKMQITGSIPNSPQVPFDWSYKELTHKLSESSTNTYSVHSLIYLDLFDIKWSESFITPLTLRGFGGKYSESIKYLGLGLGTSFLYNNRPAIVFTLDRLWGWDNNQFSNWQFGVGIKVGFFQQLYQ